MNKEFACKRFVPELYRNTVFLIKQKSPAMYLYTARDDSSYYRGSTRIRLHVLHLLRFVFIASKEVSQKPLTDDNGITGPDWGHSELVFNCFRKRCFQHTTLWGISLCYVPQPTLLFIVFIYCY